jgi:hypothetical protein
MPACRFHEDRPAIGICMRCRAAICAVCRTRVDGVNHCHACLKALGARGEEPRPATDLWPLATVALLGLSWLVLAGVLWLVQGTLAP